MSQPDSEIVEAVLVAEDLQQLVGTPCPACGSPSEGNSRFCGACSAPLETPDVPMVVSGDSGSSASALPSHTFECSNCGSTVDTSVDKRSYTCPFCDSNFVTEIQFSDDRQRPEFIIGFAITAEQAKEKYFEWLGQNSWFRPGDLAAKATTEKQKGVYLPFWHFSMEAFSRWSASIGEYWYRTETYTTRENGKTVTKTRRVRETEWFPLSGQHQRYYYGYLVPATKGISNKESHAIQPFQLSALARYRPYYLAGWMAEEQSIDQAAAISLTHTEFSKRQEREVAAFLPGDTHRSLSVQTEFDTHGSDLILLPVHVLSYRYRDRVYRFLVNGQTGKVVGEKPWSTARITSFVIAMVLLLAIAIALIVYFAKTT